MGEQIRGDGMPILWPPQVNFQMRLKSLENRPDRSFEPKPIEQLEALAALERSQPLI